MANRCQGSSSWKSSQQLPACRWPRPARSPDSTLVERPRYAPQARIPASGSALTVGLGSNGPGVSRSLTFLQLAWQASAVITQR